jgi:hypothetical protein
MTTTDAAQFAANQAQLSVVEAFISEAAKACLCHEDVALAPFPIKLDR